MNLRLANTKNPYLLQHALNPVEWYPWGEEAFEKAEKEGKLLIISIGYSSCHWCHVMEHESFNDNETADLMNRFFVSVKVDREERPDIDQIYMDSVHLMGHSGGWPLNCFVLPDKRAVFGGTYFPNQQWKEILKNLAEFYKKYPDRMLGYATELEAGLKKGKLFPMPDLVNRVSFDLIEKARNGILALADTAEGGLNRVPKFPMPAIWDFLLRESIFSHDKGSIKQVKLTLDKIGRGGIYDQVGGGFSRYSTDRTWTVPHFEKMLYDNATLISLFSLASRLFKEEEYLDKVQQSMEFAIREWRSVEGGFFSATDADSEGKEGKYYTWSSEDLKAALGNDYTVLKEFWGVVESGNWEEVNILLQPLDINSFCEKAGLGKERFLKGIRDAKTKLLGKRSDRIPPITDTKEIASWNGLMLKACCDAFLATANKSYLDLGKGITERFFSIGRVREEWLWRIAGNMNIPGFLEDYAGMTAGLISYYQITFEEDYLLLAKDLLEIVLKNFSSSDSPYFYFSSSSHEKFGVKTQETQDQVIPSSNAMMARNLWELGRYFLNLDWQNHSRKMVMGMQKSMGEHPAWHAAWASLAMEMTMEVKEVIFSGLTTDEAVSFQQSDFISGTLFALAKENSAIPICKGKLPGTKKLYFVCESGACHLPAENPETAWIEIRNQGSVSRF